MAASRRAATFGAKTHAATALQCSSVAALAKLSNRRGDKSARSQRTPLRRVPLSLPASVLALPLRRPSSLFSSSSSPSPPLRPWSFALAAAQLCSTLFPLCLPVPTSPLTSYRFSITSTLCSAQKWSQRDGSSQPKPMLLMHLGRLESSLCRAKWRATSPHRRAWESNKFRPRRTRTTQRVAADGPQETHKENCQLDGRKTTKTTRAPEEEAAVAGAQ